MWSAVRIDRTALGIVGVLRERRARAIFGYGNRQSRVARMGLVQHHAKIGKLTGIPAEISVIANCVCDPDHGFAGRESIYMRWNADLAAVGEGRGAGGIFTLCQFVQGPKEIRRSAGSFDLRRCEINLVAQ